MQVDISQVIALTRGARRVLERTGDGMKRILDRAAREERRTHAYNNRTGRLENSTFALGPMSQGNQTVVEFGARMEYASYVDNRGLMRVRELAKQAEREIDYYLDAQAQTIARR